MHLHQIKSCQAPQQTGIFHLQQALTVADIARLEVHGPEEELAKLREPLAGLNPRFFTLEFGFRR